MIPPPSSSLLGAKKTAGNWRAQVIWTPRATICATAAKFLTTIFSLQQFLILPRISIRKVVLWNQKDAHLLFQLCINVNLQLIIRWLSAFPEKANDLLERTAKKSGSAGHLADVPPCAEE